MSQNLKLRSSVSSEEQIWQQLSCVIVQVEHPSEFWISKTYYWVEGGFKYHAPLPPRWVVAKGPRCFTVIQTEVRMQHVALDGPEGGNNVIRWINFPFQCGPSLGLVAPLLWFHVCYMRLSRLSSIRATAMLCLCVCVCVNQCLCPVQTPLCFEWHFGDAPSSPLRLLKRTPC